MKTGTSIFGGMFETVCIELPELTFRLRAVYTLSGNMHKEFANTPQTGVWGANHAGRNRRDASAAAQVSMEATREARDPGHHWVLQCAATLPR